MILICVCIFFFTPAMFEVISSFLALPVYSIGTNEGFLELLDTSPHVTILLIVIQILDLSTFDMFSKINCKMTDFVYCAKIIVQQGIRNHNFSF